MHCARCWSKDWASSRTKVWELPLRLLGLTPFRCGGCGRRDYRGPVGFQIRLRLKIPKSLLSAVQSPKARKYRSNSSVGGISRTMSTGAAWWGRIHYNSPRRSYRRFQTQLGTIAATMQYYLQTPSRMFQRAPLGSKVPRAAVVSSPTRVSPSVHDEADKAPAPDPSTRDAA